MAIKDIIKESLEHYKFGAVIEVTNGLYNQYHKRAGQALRGKESLLYYARSKPKIATGVTYLNTRREPDYSTPINFIMQVEKYSNPALRAVFEKSISVPSLHRKGKELACMILEKENAEHKLHNFLSSESESLRENARYLGESIKDYEGTMANIKGVIMELYVQKLFEDELDDRTVFHRVLVKPGMIADIDVVVVCKENRFYSALEMIAEKPNINLNVLTRKT